LTIINNLISTHQDSGQDHGKISRSLKSSLMYIQTIVNSSTRSSTNTFNRL